MEALLLILRDMIPRQIKVVILADRGFGRTALATFCQQQGFGYVIRIQPSVTVRLKGFHGKLLDYPVKKGIAKVLKRVSYRSDGAVTQSVVVRPHDRPAGHGASALQALRPTHDHRAAVP